MSRALPSPGVLALTALCACTGGPGSGADTGEPTADDTAEPGSTEVFADAGPDREVLVGEELVLDGGESQGESFLWDMGDGTRLEGLQVAHAWSDPGRYAVVLQATGADGTWKSDTALVSVALAPTEPAPSWSSTLALDEGLLWAVLPESPTLTRVDLDADEMSVLEACAGPRTLSASGGRVAVACEEADQLALVEDGLLALVDLPVASRPFGVAGRDGRWFVSLQATGEVAEVLDGELLALHPVGPDPRGLALTHDDRVLVTHFRSTAEARLSVLDPATGAVEAVILDPDTGGDSDTTTGGLPNLLEQVVPSPAGHAWYLPGLHANVLRGEHRSGEALTFETSLRAVLLTVDAEALSESPAGRKQFDERGRASALVPSPRGELLYVLHPGTGTVSVLDAVTGDLAGSLLDVGTFPTGLALSEDGATLYVSAWLDREILAFPVDDLSVEPEVLGRWPLVQAEPLADAVLLGKRVFHDASDTRLSRSGYVSCAHCHPDGRDDGLTWDFTDRGEGLRNTTSLEGRAGTAMGPLHWSANFDEVQDFEHDMRGPFGGTGFLDEADWAECGEPLGVEKAGRSEELDALAAYLESLSATPPSPHAGSPEGEALFASAGCADCHPAPLYTDSSLETLARHDVGTLTEASGQRLGEALDGLDTPTLLGAWATGPWLHDGSAPTLEAAIGAHSSAAALSEEELALLADHVRSL